MKLIGAFTVCLLSVFSILSGNAEAQSCGAPQGKLECSYTQKIKGRAVPSGNSGNLWTAVCDVNCSKGSELWPRCSGNCKLVKDPTLACPGDHDLPGTPMPSIPVCSGTKEKCEREFTTACQRSTQLPQCNSLRDCPSCKCEPKNPIPGTPIGQATY